MVSSLIAEFSIVPVGAGVSLSPFVAECLRIVKESGLKHQLTPMGTVLEGDGEQVMATIMACHAQVLRMSDRVVTSIKIDDRRDRPADMERKVRSVEEKLRKG
ncbi:MAG: MTH1187 family thiamine-binding protein [Methanomassiliicoccales archaeon]